MPQFDNIRQGTLSQVLYYGIPFAVLFVIFDHYYHKKFDKFCLKYYIDESIYKGKAREDRAYLLTKWSYCLIYYTVTSTATYFLVKDTDIFPTWLGGKGSCLNIVQTAPRIPQATLGMKIIYMIQLGKHLGRLFIHIFLRKQGNFYEYTLHHSLSVFLIFFSFLTNLWLNGLMVLLTMDISDAFLTIMRGYKDYKNYSEAILKFIYVFGLFIWLSMRFGVYIGCCVYTAVLGPSYGREKLTSTQYQVLMVPYLCMSFMIVVLLILNTFWTFYILKAFVEKVVSAKISKNTYEAPPQQP